MSNRGHLRLDLVAAVLLFTGLSIAATVLSYDPADSPGATVFPSNSTPTNLLGTAGAWLASGLFGALGITVHILLAGWFSLVILLFLRQQVLTWSLRIAGWLLLLPGAAVLAQWFGPAISGGPAVGNGGSLGAWLSTWLEANLDANSRLALVSASVALGGGLALGFVLVRVVKTAWFFGQQLLAAVDASARWSADLALPLLRRGKIEMPEVPCPAPIIRSEPSIEDEPTVPSLQEEKAEKTAKNAIPIHHAVQPPAASDSATGDAGKAGDEQYADYELPALTLLDDPSADSYRERDDMLRERAALVEKTFADFNLGVKVVGIHTGPVVTQYEVALETGLRVHKVTRMADDLALNLKVPSVRIVAPLPKKNTVGIEVPNEQRAMVRLKEVILTSGLKPSGRSAWSSKLKLPLFLGKDTEGKPLVNDLAEMPHLLIAGRTGTGKSVCMNALILSLLMTRRPDEVKMIMIDPKKLELSEYSRIPHLMHPVVTDMKKAEAILSWAVDKMEERYDILSRARVRNIAGYNELSQEEILRRVQPDEEERKLVPDRMPYIVIFIDEMADLMAQMKKEVEGHIIRLAQKSRAAGIHLVVATQKPIVDVITSLIKSNLPARICFQVTSRSDSQVVLDDKGGDKLLGKGDMLFLQPGTSTLVRAQGTYASDAEVHNVVDSLECEPCFAEELIGLNLAGKDNFLEALRERDPVYEQAIEIVIRERRGSTSLLQRALGIGYGKAARLIDYMAEDGIVGAYNGSQARDVLYTPEQWDQIKQGNELVETA